MTSEASTAPASALVFTQHAAEKVKELSAQHHKVGSKLRVYIQGGGCSGFQYGFTLEEQASDDDMVIETEDVQLLVDPMSFQYLMGAEIDYLEDLQGSRFVINNPNASTTCGCGASFSI
jgi:iron-sulfur cluster insertion protein